MHKMHELVGSEAVVAVVKTAYWMHACWVVASPFGDPW